MKYTDTLVPGYLRADGRKGIRNKLLVMYTVDCCWHVAQSICDALRGEGEDVDLVGNGQCFDHQIMIQRMLRLMLHPNVGALLVVGHGCEFIQAEKLSEYARAHGKPSAWFFDQSFGTSGSIEYGVKRGRELLREIEGAPRVQIPLHELCVAALAVSPDATSKAACEAFGRFLDAHIDAGGTAVFDDMAEAKSRLADFVARGADGALAEAAKKLEGVTANENFAYEKSGTRPIEGVLKISQKPPHPGLWYVDALPDGDAGAYMARGAGAHAMESVTAGAHMVFLLAGGGATLNTPVAPCLKVTANAETFETMSGDIDLSLAGLSAQEAVDALCGAMARAASVKTKGEALGHMEGSRLAVVDQRSTVCRKAQ